MNDQAVPNVVQFDNISAGYSTRTILNHINIGISKGEFVYLVGRTGSGKSTLLKMIYADVKPLSGELRVGPFNLESIHRDEIPFLRRRLGIVFQDFQLLPDRNVYDNIHFALKATGWKDSNKIKKRITELLVKVGMSGKAQAFPHQLSGGEQQRVTIARSLINDPIILIADEPTGNLDPEASSQILEIIKKVNIGGTAILMATHEYEIIRKYPARVLEITTDGIINHEKAISFLSKPSYY